jgi:DNA repair protein RecO (recombination protein O)
MTGNERSLRTEAVVLRHSDWGEADRLLTIFTSYKGKLRAIAKGVRKLNSRKAGHLEPFTLVNLMLARGRDFWIVTQAEMVENFSHLRDELALTGAASYLIELVDRLTYEEQENHPLFQILEESLKRLNGGDDVFSSTRYFELRLFDHLGYRPQLVNCVTCGKEIKPEDQFFSFEKGGILCPSCGNMAKQANPISLNALRYLRHFQRSSYSEVKNVKVPGAIRKEMENLTGEYITYLLERGLNTPAFIQATK